jgi:nucleotide-binding universal stress UspA family protein
MKIICATDFSEPSLQATRVAARLARRLGDRLVLVHAWTSPFLYYREVITDPLALEQKLMARATADLESTAAKLRAEGSDVATHLVQGGDPAQAVTNLANGDPEVRLVVVGARGGHAVARLFFGSSAERIVLLSERPVLVVHPGGGLEEWAEGRRPLRVLAGLDRSPASVAAVSWLQGLRQTGPSDITFLHAFWPVEQYARLGVPPGALDLAASDQATMGVLARELRPLIADLGGQGSTELKLKPVWGSPAGPLLDEARAMKADLVVLGTHHKRALERLWVGSTVHPVVRAAELPVLCVPVTEARRAVLPRPRVRHVLCATDFSDTGDRAVAYAFELARDGGAVTLCHVHERPLPVPAYAYQDSHDALPGATRAELEARLRALVPPDAAASGVTTAVSVIDGGHAATGIMQEANRAGADVICLGSHGRGTLGRALLGSVAETVARRAERPVLIVRQGT